MQREQKDRTVLIPAELYIQIEERAMAMGSGSVDEYVRFVLEKSLEEEGAFTKEEEEEVKKRLRDLGYLD